MISFPFGERRTKGNTKQAELIRVCWSRRSVSSPRPRVGEEPPREPIQIAQPCIASKRSIPPYRLERIPNTHREPLYHRDLEQRVLCFIHSSGVEERQAMNFLYDSCCPGIVSSNLLAPRVFLSDRSSMHKCLSRLSNRRITPPVQLFSEPRVSELSVCSS